MTEVANNNSNNQSGNVSGQNANGELDYYRLTERTYIKMPDLSADDNLRNQVKEAGGIWDKTRKCWYFVRGVARDETFLRSMGEEVDPDRDLTKVVTRYVEIDKDKRTPEVDAALKEAKAMWDPDNQAWRVKESNNQLPDALSGFRMKTYDELVKRVYVDVPKEVRGDKTKTAGLRWDRAHQAFYTTIGMKDKPEQAYKGFNVFKPDSVAQVLYFQLPEAKNDANLRNQLKEAGARWTPTFQAWQVTVTKDTPLPQFLNEADAKKPEQLPRYKIHQYSIPEAEPSVVNSKQLRDQLYAAGVKFNNYNKLHEIWLPEGADVPPVLAGRKEVNTEKKENQQTQQTQSQSQAHTRQPPQQQQQQQQQVNQSGGYRR